MSLNPAHTGYAFQDLLCSYFILEEIISENDAVIKIDKKEVENDRFDDIVIRNKKGIFRKQIKYSDSKEDGHTLTKDDLASDSNYNLALHSLFKSWQKYPEEARGELKLCLGWNNPNSSDAILYVLSSIENSSFHSFKTNSYQIDLERLWKADASPLSSWRKFKQESKNINRNEFAKFIQSLIIEVNLPKASLSISSPGEMEQILITQVLNLGVGEYPNENIGVEETILSLVQIVTNARSRGLTLKSSEVLRELRIKTDYGKIEQLFPVDFNKIINTTTAVQEIESTLINNNKLIITGEPGAGKSWFINNLEQSLKDDFIFVKHYCYTDLKDDLQVDRIKVNTLYGNLIAAILKNFPKIKKHKKKKWASNLDELNLLISYIPQNAVIVIDGLDHVQRIYELKKNTVTLAEVDILSAIEKINLTSEKVKIIVLSQPILELKNFKNFVKIALPKWTEEDVLKYMKTVRITNSKLSKNKNLSIFLTEKSAGNPLYLSYLIEEIKNTKELTLKKLNELPPYSFNLSEYYDYILTKLNEGSTVPRIFSGVNFSLNKNELAEITGMGDYVNNDLSAMLPILSLNLSTGGYSIYHESFRRFVIEKLTLNRVNIWQSIFRPVVEWFENKGFYEFNKAAKFYLPLLYENNKNQQIANYISFDFLSECLYYGHSWDLMTNNFKYLALSSTAFKSFDKLIFIAEHSRILTSVKQDYEIVFKEYFKALGAIHGFQVAANSLVLEGESTIDKKLGLSACRICEYNGISAPWDLYFGEDRKGTSIQLNELAEYIIYLLSNRNYKELEYLAGQIYESDDFKDIFQEEINNWNQFKRDNTWLNHTPTTKKLLYSEVKKVSIKKLYVERDKLLKIDFINDKAETGIYSFFDGLDYLVSVKKYKQIEELIEPFYAKNWFYNWMVFYSKLKICIGKTALGCPYDFEELKETFKYLIYDTEVFKGSIRTCDLHAIRKLIHESIREGLNYVQDEKDREEITKLLQKVSHETTTTIQNSPGGPLIPSAMLDILNEYASESQIDATIEGYEQELESERQKRYYQDISEHYFKLTVLYSKRGDTKKADLSFREGIKFLLSYTDRKDTTLGELIDSIVSLNSRSPELGLEYIKKIKVLSDTVVNHTDGKGTKWYPIYWFEKFHEISPRKSLIFLAHELLTIKYDWRLEDNLKHFLISTNGRIDPVVELYIARTFPIKDGEDFLKNAFHLSDKVKEQYPVLSENSIRLFLTKLGTGRNTKYSDDFINSTRRLYNSLHIAPRKYSRKENSNSNRRNVDIKSVLKNKFNLDRIEFSKMSDTELITYCKSESIPETDAQGLYLRLEGMDWGIEKKEVISLLARKDRYSSEINHSWVQLIFQDNSKESVFFYMSKFIYQHGGWFEYFANIDAFKEAYKRDAALALDFFFEILPPLISEPAFTHKLSANLINVLTAANFPTDKIIELWQILYKIIDDRLPAKSEYNWEKEIPRPLKSYSDDELLVILLISRFRSFSSERTHRVIEGLHHLLTHHPKLLINPLKWFFKNLKEFLEINTLSVLQLLYKHHLKDDKFILNFNTELKSIYPTNYFLIDWIIEQMLNLKSRKKLIEPSVIYPPSKELMKIFKRINSRHLHIENAGFDFENIVGEYKAYFGKEHSDLQDLYYSRVNKLFVDNLYSPNYMLKLINERLYNDFRDFASYYGNGIYELLRLKDRELIVQYLSAYNRPSNLIKPSNTHGKLSNQVQIENGWVRIGLYEKEYHQTEFLEKFKVSIVYGGLVFSDDDVDFPFSLYILNFDSLTSVVPFEDEFYGFTTVTNVQKGDMFETLKLLWLHPLLLNLLNLKTGTLDEGLHAVDENNKVALKYNTWKEDYLGDRFDDEIPKLDGAELLLREDFFDEICKKLDFANPKFHSIVI